MLLVQHMVDIQKATADFREASERKPDTSSQTEHVANILLHGQLCRRDSASTTGTLDLDG